MGKVTQEAVKYMLERYTGKVFYCEDYEKKLRALHCSTCFFEEYVKVQFGTCNGKRAVKIIGAFDRPHGWKW